MPKVSVAIPTYNRRDYLKQSIESVLSQTFQDFKILIFDNHSDYNVAEFLAEFNDSRIALIASAQNIGSHGNFRRIYTYNYNTEYLVIFHDDDCMHPLLLEREVVVMENNPNVVWAGASLNFIKNDNQINKFATLGKQPGMIKILDTAGAVREILASFHLCFDSIMYRTAVLTDSAPFVDRFDKWSDRPYCISLIGSKQAAFLQEKLVNYRLHGQQDSQAQMPVLDYLEYSKNLLNFYFTHLPQPLNVKDEVLFNSFSSNSTLRMSLAKSTNFKEFKKYLEDYKIAGLFNIKYLTLRGMYGFGKDLLKKFFT